MSDVNVNIQIEAMPWKNQDRQTLKLELDHQTSISEIIEYLIDQKKIVVTQNQIDVYNGTNFISHSMMISDLYKPGKDVSLKFKSLGPKGMKQPPPIQPPAPKYPAAESMRIPVTQNFSSSSYPSWGNAQKAEHSVPTSQNPSNPSFKKQNSYDQTFDSTIQQAQPSKQPIKLDTQVPKLQFSNYSNKESITKKPNIEFSLKFKEGNYERYFQYSSKKVEESSEEVEVERSSNNVISIVINDGGRRMKFQVEKE